MADTGHNRIIEIAANSLVVSTVIDSGLNKPLGLAIDSLGNLYVADSGNNAIKEIVHNDYLLNSQPQAASPVAINALIENTEQIELSKSIYTAFSTETAVTAANFSNATAASSASDYLFYDNASGGLFYEAGGSTGSNAVEIAVIGVNNHPATLSAGDFKLVG